jgi:hypothetical protein
VKAHWGRVDLPRSTAREVSMVKRACLTMAPKLPFLRLRVKATGDGHRNARIVHTNRFVTASDEAINDGSGGESCSHGPDLNAALGRVRFGPAVREE